jgi:hypothetical protein
MNVNRREQKFRKGAPLAQCEPVTLVPLTDRRQPQARNANSRLQDVTEAARPHLDGEFRELKELVAEYEDIFAGDSEDHGWTNKVYHRIDTGEALPIRQHPMRLPLAKRAEVSEMLEDMQRRGILEESDSSWSFPIVLVRKDGKLRFCVDYRKLNDVTKKDCFPLPRIDDTLDTLAGAKWFSTLDLKSGYWQVDLHPDKAKTAFSTGQGLWQFTVMPFGLCNAPATFEKLMDTVLRGLTYELCLVYLDDVIVIGRTFQELLLNLRKVFQQFREARRSVKSCERRCDISGILCHLKG